MIDVSHGVEHWAAFCIAHIATWQWLIELQVMIINIRRLCGRLCVHFALGVVRAEVVVE